MTDMISLNVYMPVNKAKMQISINPKYIVALGPEIENNVLMGTFVQMVNGVEFVTPEPREKVLRKINYAASKKFPTGFKFLGGEPTNDTFRSFQRGVEKGQDEGEEEIF